MRSKYVVLLTGTALIACTETRAVTGVDWMASQVDAENPVPKSLVTVNGSFQDGILPGVARLQRDGSVAGLRRLSEAESGGSYSAFGVTHNSRGEYWTSLGWSLIQFDSRSRKVVRSVAVPTEPFLVIAFGPLDRLIGWSNSNGYLYEIDLQGEDYTETRLGFVGLNAGGVTGLAFAADGTLYGTDNRFKRLIRIDIETGTITAIAQLPFGSYIGLAVAPNGTLFTTESLASSIQQYDLAGNLLWTGPYVSENPVTGIDFYAPAGAHSE